jgi:putative transposase
MNECCDHPAVSYVMKTRDRKAALTFLRKAPRKHGLAEVIVTDTLRFYGAAMKDRYMADRPEIGRWRKNWAENSHLAFRRRERAMLRVRRV